MVDDLISDKGQFLSCFEGEVKHRHEAVACVLLLAGTVPANPQPDLAATMGANK